MDSECALRVVSTDGLMVGHLGVGAVLAQLVAGGRAVVAAARVHVGTGPDEVIAA